ncbi:MAG: hypothetical protein ACK5MA_02045 [Parachlamydiaceae bacterium]
MSGITEFNRAFGWSLAPVDEYLGRGDLNLRKFYFSFPILGIFAGISGKDRYGLTTSEKVRIGLSSSVFGIAVLLPLDIIATLTTQVKNRSEWHKSHPEQA